MIREKILYLIKSVAKKIYSFSIYLFNLLLRSKIIDIGTERKLYKTRFGSYFWLKKGSSIDDSIISRGLFEEASTRIVMKFVKNGYTVLDIGANIGYYSVLFSKLVGSSGQVIAFEPTKYYLKVLENNLLANNIKNVDIVPLGLSDEEKQLEIQIGVSSATLHATCKDDYISKELITLTTLNNFVRQNNIANIDFIKIDVDGHEPAILKGGWEVINMFRPLILMEISHAHYLQYGVTAWDFYSLIKSNGLHIYNEDTLEEFKDVSEFLCKCGNFAYSANILLSHDSLLHKK